MRPKNQVLVLDRDEDRGGALRFLLEVHGYAARAIATPAEGRKLAEIELLIACWPFEAAETHPLKERLGCPLLVIRHDQRNPPAGVRCDRLLLKGSTSSAEILEAVHILCARKRGPRKGFQRNPQPAAPAA